MQRNTVDKIYQRLNPVSAEGCWLWPGSKTDGYGCVSFGGKVRRVHRVLYEDIFGPILDGFEPDHLCRVRDCANPFHLEAVTKRENILRGFGTGAKYARQTHCKNGHELIGDNLRECGPSQNGKRGCRICHNEDMRRLRAAKRMR